MGSPISLEQWEKRKPEIMRLYYDVQMPLKSVMREIRSSDFDPSESQYRTKLRKWPRRKYKKSAGKTYSLEGPEASSTSFADLPPTQIQKDDHTSEASFLPNESQLNQQFDWIMAPASPFSQQQSTNSMSTGLYSQLPLETSPSSLANSGITEEHPLFSQIEDNPFTESLFESVSSRQEKFRYRRNVKSFGNSNDRRVQRRAHIRRHDINKPSTLSKGSQANNETKSAADFPTDQVPEEQASLIWHQQPLQQSPQYLLPHPPMAPDSFAYDPVFEFQGGNPS
ncbi:MAG: hypothetical protein Q9167_001983 [Letrouitia subvulpina]